jgi:hypothetical protein
MAATAYLVRFKGADLPPELVIAETIEFHGEHLAFLRSDGSLAALFVLEVVESCLKLSPKEPIASRLVPATTNTIA